MSHNQHPVRKTLVFFAAVVRHFRLHGSAAMAGWLVGGMADGKPTPHLRSTCLLKKCILEAYASPEASLDSTFATTDSLNLADVDSPADVNLSHQPLLKLAHPSKASPRTTEVPLTNFSMKTFNSWAIPKLLRRWGISSPP